MSLTKVMKCKSCGTTSTVTLVRNIGTTGASYVYWECQVCGNNAMGAAHWLPHEPIKNFGIDILTIPIKRDDRTEVCAVCGVLGAQLHHWAPRHIFGDEVAEMWPKNYLCQTHHTFWHQMVTPEMSKVKGNGHV